LEVDRMSDEFTRQKHSSNAATVRRVGFDIVIDIDTCSIR